MFKMQLHPSFPFTNSLSRVESTSAHLVAAAANTNCFRVDILKRNTSLWGLTARGQRFATSDWVYFSHSAISCAPGILSCEKQMLCRDFFVGFFVVVFFFLSGRWQEVELPFPITPNFSYFSSLLILYWG